jgi:acetoin utilization deacetylase AcuC-like enzyme/GNAT superfamily N-acetyltransferase
VRLPPTGKEVSVFRIRRILDDTQPANQTAIREVQSLLAELFPGISPEEVAAIPDKLQNPFTQRFRMILFVAEEPHGPVLGFAILLHEPILKFCFLDFLANSPRVQGRGLGSALYEQVREEARSLDAGGLFFECLPDDPDRSADPAIRKVNAQRLRFYERYGARPIIGTAYETPVSPTDTDNLPHLVYDSLDRGLPLAADYAREVVRAILERKYSHLVGPAYVDQVVESFRDDPVRIRPVRYSRANGAAAVVLRQPSDRILLTVTDKHRLHHIRERGYVESPVRIGSILKELNASGLCEQVAVREFPLDHITAIHDIDFVEFLRRACELVPAGKSIYPYVFPIRNVARPPRELLVRAGYYCIDTFTPIHRNAFQMAKHAVDCTLTAAQTVAFGRGLAYALVRPPGHHAETRVFGGFCYFNNAAIAAHYFSQWGKVAILDVDYHHGNGQQEIFYERNDVLTVSIHGDPDFAYPYFTGFADETGRGAGTGFNMNLPLPESQTGEQYRAALAEALAAVRRFEPKFLVVSLGLDPAKGDPTGTWSLGARDFRENGQMIGRLGLPTLVVQEGGYRTRTLGANARSFLSGLLDGRLNLEEPASAKTASLEG